MKARISGLPLPIHTRLVRKAGFLKPGQAIVAPERANQELFECSEEINSTYRSLKQADDFKTFMNLPGLDTSCEALVILITLLNRMEGIVTTESCQGLYHGENAGLKPSISLMLDPGSTDVAKEPALSVLTRISYLLNVHSLRTCYYWSLEVRGSLSAAPPPNLNGQLQVPFEISIHGLANDPDLFVMKNQNERSWPIEINPEVRNRVTLDINTLALGFLREYELNKDS